MTVPSTLFLVLSIFTIGLGALELSLDLGLILGGHKNSGGKVTDAPATTLAPVTSAPPTDSPVFPKSNSSEAAIRAILGNALASVRCGASPAIVDTLEQGLKVAIQLITLSSDATAKSIAVATELSCQNPEAAVKAIERGRDTAQVLFEDAEISVYYAFKAAGDRSGDESKDWIKRGLKLVHNGLKYAVVCLRAQLAINGLTSNLAAAAKGLEAYQEAARTGSEAAYASIALASNTTFQRLSDEAKCPKQPSEEQACRTPISTLSAEAEAAESAIKLKAKLALESVDDPLVASALNEIKELLVCGIRTAATGEALALKAIAIAAELAPYESDIALAALKAGFKSLKVAMVTAANRTSQGLDVAKNNFEIAKLKEFVSAVSTDLENIQKLAPIGFKIHGQVTKQVLLAIYKSVLAESFELYSLLVTIAEKAF